MKTETKHDLFWAIVVLLATVIPVAVVVSIAYVVAYQESIDKSLRFIAQHCPGSGM